MTPFQSLKGKAFSGVVARFGEVVLAKQHRQLDIGKFAIDWAKGVWVGRAAEDNTHIVLLPEGTLTTRTIHRDCFIGSRESRNIAIGIGYL